ncbi:MAG: hypothetical protein WC822_00685 [Candidatus Paceibacterota bacterium]|jgi:hypothetical protein
MKKGIFLVVLVSLLLTYNTPKVDAYTSATLTPSTYSCTISSGSSTCNISFSWYVSNPYSTSTISNSVANNNVIAYGNYGNNISFSVKYPNETFFLRHDGTTLTQSTVTASCASGSYWNGSICSYNNNNYYDYNNYNNNYYNYNTSAPTAITGNATNVGQTSARFNGTGLLNNNIYSTNYSQYYYTGLNYNYYNTYTTGYFEYGTTPSLGSITVSKDIGNSQSNSFYQSMFNLDSGTTYYYRAVVTNQYGTSRGEIVSFSTNAKTVYIDNVVYKNIVTKIPDNTIYYGNSNPVVPVYTNYNNATDVNPYYGTGVIQQGASTALFGTGFLPTSLTGWIFLLLLIVAIIFITREAYRKPNTVVVSKNNNDPIF